MLRYAGMMVRRRIREAEAGESRRAKQTLKNPDLLSSSPLFNLKSGSAGSFLENLQTVAPS